MLNERPKKVKNYSDPTKWQLFWRIQGECWRRMVTPYLMYLFMSLLLLSVQAIIPDENSVVEIVLGVICILGGGFFNAHLLYHTGILHYDNFITGNIHRRNALYGIQSGGDHRPEREFRPWEGFYIGLLISLPVLILGIFAHYFYSVASLFFMMFAGWAIIPIAWFGTAEGGGLLVDPLWSLLFMIMPILISGVAYLVGALVEKRRKANGAAHDEKIKEAGKKK